MLLFGWGPGIEGRLTRARDSEANTVKTDENHGKLPKIIKVIEK